MHPDGETPEEHDVDGERMDYEYEDDGVEVVVGDDVDGDGVVVGDVMGGGGVGDLEYRVLLEVASYYSLKGLVSLSCSKSLLS